MADYCTRCGSDTAGRIRFCLNCGEHRQSEGIGLISKYYELLESLKKDISGAVFKALDTQFDSLVCLKKIVSSKSEFEDLEAEKRRFHERVLELARLRHPGLPEIVDSFIMKDSTTNQTCYYIVRDFIEGKDLVSLMEARGGASLPVDEALDYFKQMLEIFNYLHNRVPPVFFRNVSPSSFMIEKNRVHCVDFGISQVPMDSQRKLVISGFASQEQEKTTSGVDRNLTAIATATHFLLTGMTPEESCRQSLRRINPNVPEHFDPS